MSIFTDYAAKMRQQQTPFNGGLQQYLQDNDPMRQKSPLFNPSLMTQKTVLPAADVGTGSAPTVSDGGTGSVPQQQVDTSDAIGSLAEMMGPTPAEREAAERRMMKNRAQMAAWTGLFDGLRQLGNLYYTAKGATPQQFTDPYAQVDRQIQQQRQTYSDLANYRRNYATSLYNLRRQMEQDKRAGEEHKAKLDWYKNRDEQNAEKVAIQRFKAEVDAAYKDATLEEKKRMNDIMADVYAGRIDLMDAQKRLAEARAAHVGSSGGGGTGVPYKEHYVVQEIDPAKGNKITKYVAGRHGGGNKKQTSSSKQSKGAKGSSGKTEDKYKNTRALGL